MYEIYRKNEGETNEIVAGIFWYILAFLLLIAVFCWTGIFDIYDYMIDGFLAASLIPMLLPIILVKGLCIDRGWVKYVLITCVCLVVGMAYVVFTFQMVLIFMIPSVIAVFYLDKRILYFTAVVMSSVIAGAHLITCFWMFQPWLEPFADVREIMLYGALPRIMQYLFGTVLLYLLMRRITAFMNGFLHVVRKSREEETEDRDGAELKRILEGLTEREKEVFELMVLGKTNTQIAKLLCLSGGTVKNYVSAIYDKIGSRDRTVLVLKYSRFYTVHDQSHG